MGKYVDQAVTYHKNFQACSTSVLKAYKDVLNLSDREAQRIAGPMAGGAMGTCGAVLAAKYVLQQLGRDADAKKLEQDFIRQNGASSCREIRGKRLRSCRGCVIDAATLLEEQL